MSGSRLGRGRGARLAVYGGCGAVVILLIFLYRAATSEMARLRELHVQCAHQQEALAAQLQVIFEYKVRLEKSLAEEKSSNAAVKQELQQRASREKSLRDKDSMEAMQRFNSLQQTYKLLQTEHQDLQDECKKREKQAFDDTKRLESTLQELRSSLRIAGEEKKKALEHLKNKYLEIEDEKARLEEKYNELMKANGNSDSTIEHLRKETFQLKRELEEAKRSCKGSSTQSSSQLGQQNLVKADEQIQKSSQQQQQSPAPTSSMKANLPKAESSTRPNNNPSTPSDKLPPVKPVSRVKLPAGVAPIPPIIDHKDEDPEEKKEEVRKKAPNPLVKNNPEDSKEKEQPAEPGNLDLPFPALPAGRHVGQQILDRRLNDGENWFRVGPGVQEIGDDLNPLGRIPGLEAGDRQGDAGDDQYDGVDYDKEPQQKNNDIHLVEGEDEAEDEEDQPDYPHMKQEKRE